MIRSNNFSYSSGGTLFCESVDLSQLPTLIPESEYQTTTPFYVYSKSQIVENIRNYQDAFEGKSHVIGFSLKVPGSRTFSLPRVMLP